jgi:hypothetical protein
LQFQRPVIPAKGRKEKRKGGRKGGRKDGRKEEREGGRREEYAYHVKKRVSKKE